MAPLKAMLADAYEIELVGVGAPDVVRFDALDLGLAEDNHQDNERAESGGSA